MSVQQQPRLLRRVRVRFAPVRRSQWQDAVDGTGMRPAGRPKDIFRSLRELIQSAKKLPFSWRVTLLRTARHVSKVVVFSYVYLFSTRKPRTSGISGDDELTALSDNPANDGKKQP